MFTSTGLPILSQPGFLNLTSFFRSDSDFYSPYLISTERSEPFTLPFVAEIVRPKKKMVLWFVSHCYTESRREDYMAGKRDS